MMTASPRGIEDALAILDMLQDPKAMKAALKELAAKQKEIDRGLADLAAREKALSEREDKHEKTETDLAKRAQDHAATVTAFGRDRDAFEAKKALLAKLQQELAG